MRSRSINNPVQNCIERYWIDLEPTISSIKALFLFIMSLAYRCKWIYFTWSRHQENPTRWPHSGQSILGCVRSLRKLFQGQSYNLFLFRRKPIKLNINRTLPAIIWSATLETRYRRPIRSTHHTKDRNSQNRLWLILTANHRYNARRCMKQK